MNNDKFFEKYKKKIDDIKFNVPKFEYPDWFQGQQVSDFPKPTENVMWTPNYGEK